MEELNQTEQRAGANLIKRNLLKAGAVAAALGIMSVVNTPFARAQDMSNGANNFYVSDRVTVQKVTFKNQYQMTVTGNLFIPKNLNRNAKTPTIVVGAKFANQVRHRLCPGSPWERTTRTLNSRRDAACAA